MNRSSNTTLTPILVHVADMYYSRSLSQQEIAEALGLSRSLVALYLKKARDQGIVRIQIIDPCDLNADLERRFEHVGRLKNVCIIPGSIQSAPAMTQAVANAAARFLDTELEYEDCLGIGPGEITAEVARQLSPAEHRSVNIVAVTGEPAFLPDGKIPPVHCQVEMIAHAFNASAYYLPAPLVLESEQTCQLLLNDPSIQSVKNWWDRLTHLICDISPITAAGAPYTIPGVDPLTELCGMDCVGDIYMRFFDSEGRFLYHPINNRVVAISAKQISRVENILAVANGEEKAAAVACLVKCGLVTDLFIDENLALAVLKILGK